MIDDTVLGRRQMFPTSTTSQQTTRTQRQVRGDMGRNDMERYGTIWNNVTNIYVALHTVYAPLQRSSRHQSHVHNHPVKQCRLHTRVLTTNFAGLCLYRWRNLRNYRSQGPLPRLRNSTGLRDRRSHRHRVDVMYHAYDHP